MDEQQYPQSASHAYTIEAQAAPQELVRSYLSKVYCWMALCLAVTAGVAIYAVQDPRTLFWVMEHNLMICIGTFVFVLIMGFGARALTSGALSIMLLAFAAMQGLLFGPIVALYTQESLGLAFACTAGMYGAMGLYGAFTKRDISGWGGTLRMLLWGLIIAGLANLFFGNSTADLVISGIGVVTFSLFTAYDTNKIMNEGRVFTDPELRAKGTVFGALTLYLDFIILFLYLLRFLGRLKD